MSSETVGSDEAKSGRAGRQRRTKWYVLSYPMFWLAVIFLIPMAMLVVFSFYVNIPGGAYRPGFTIENYVRFLTTRLYLEQLWLTIEVSLVTTVASLVLGYPVAYYLARMDRPRLRSVLLITIVSTLWITYIIRAYAWQVILASRGILSTVAVGVGLLQSYQSFYPGYWALIVGMVYVFLPFMILSLYSSLRNVNWELIEASKNLGAGPLTTFRRITLPLSKNGVLSGSALVFILALGAYVIPRLLGSASERTLPVLIELQIIQETNYPFGAVMSIALVVVVVVSLGMLLKFTNLTAAGLGGDER
jgi:putative spermidine/putrescine transport system permease protein